MEVAEEQTHKKLGSKPILKTEGSSIGQGREKYLTLYIPQVPSPWGS